MISSSLSWANEVWGQPGLRLSKRTTKVRPIQAHEYTFLAQIFNFRHSLGTGDIAQGQPTCLEWGFNAHNNFKRFTCHKWKATMIMLVRNMDLDILGKVTVFYNWPLFLHMVSNSKKSHLFFFLRPIPKGIQQRNAATNKICNYDQPINILSSKAV